MAHRKVESPDDLRNFSKCVVALRTILYGDRPLDKVEFLFMENHMHVLEMAYLRWKLKQVWSTDFH